MTPVSPAPAKPAVGPAGSGPVKAGTPKQSKAQRAKAARARAEALAGQSGSRQPGPADPEAPDARPFWRRRWPLIALAVVVVVLAVLALKFPASGNDASRTGGPAPVTAAPSPTTTQSVVSSAVGAVTGLSAKVNKTAVELHWLPVPGATSYLVQRDAGQPNQASFPASKVTFGDRPGDGDLHTYAVVAVDQAGLSGPVGSSVQGRATAPYGPRQNIASAWTGIIPPAPGGRGSAGQVCRGATAGDVHATGLIRCRFHNGVRLDILSYASSTDRDLRAVEVAQISGVTSTTWTATPPSKVSTFTGRLLSSSAPGGPRSKVASGPWRWWTFDSVPTFAMYAVWPGHSPQDLSHWWWQTTPFRR